MDVKQSNWRSFSGLAKFVTLFEALLIGFLSYWLYEESLANPYLAVYVNSVLQAEGATIGIFIFIVVLLGGVTGMLFLRGKNGKVTLETVDTVSSAPSLSPPKPVTVPVETSPVQSRELHPVVAALKAELSGSSLGFGAAPLTMTPPMPRREPVPAPESSQVPIPHHTVNPATISPNTPRPSTVIVGAMPGLARAEPHQLAPRTFEGPRPILSPTPNVPVVQPPEQANQEEPGGRVLKKVESEKRPDPRDKQASGQQSQ